MGCLMAAVVFGFGMPGSATAELTTESLPVGSVENLLCADAPTKDIAYSLAVELSLTPSDPETFVVMVGSVDAGKEALQRGSSCRKAADTAFNNAVAGCARSGCR